MAYVKVKKMDAEQVACKMKELGEKLADGIEIVDVGVVKVEVGGVPKHVRATVAGMADFVKQELVRVYEAEVATGDPAYLKALLNTHGFQMVASAMGQKLRYRMKLI